MKKNLMNAAVFTGLMVFVVAGVIIVATFLESSFGLYRVNYADCYGEFALTFGLGYYLPVKHVIPVTAFAIMTVFISAYAAFQGLSVVELTEYLAPFSALAALGGLILAFICVKIDSSLAELAMGNLQHFLAGSLGVFIFSIIVGVAVEAILNRIKA